MIRFEWDEQKNLSNLRKHGIAFQEALAIFGDPQAILKFDRVVDGEKQWQTTGLLKSAMLLLVVHAIREEDVSDEVIRIISARTATRSERRVYEAENGLLHS